MTVLVADTPLSTLAEIEHLLLDLDQRGVVGAGAVVGTHEVRGDRPHYAVSVEVAGSAVDDVADFLRAADCAVRPLPDHVAEAGDALFAEVRDRTGGRAVLFPGGRELTGAVTAEDLLRTTPIDAVMALGGAAVALDCLIITRDFIRPRWHRGELVLHVLPAGPNTFAPFEVPNPTPCCAGHA